MAKNDARSSVLKALQFKFYSFLSSRWGMAMCIIGAFISFNTVFQLVSIMGGVEYQSAGLLAPRDFGDNVGGRNFQSVLCAEPIDIVYTWVNGSDPLLIKAVNDLKRRLRDPSIPECKDKQDPSKNNCYRDDNPASRYIDNQELRYSLRSIENFAPWIRHIFLVTNGQVPSWLDLSNPKISIVTHQEIFRNVSHLPTFSSPSIETHIHRIPGLSKKFLYLNDDVMFGRPVFPDDFMTQGGGQKVFLSWPVPNCNDGCPNNWIGDGFCDAACNVTLCDFDGNDCNNSTGQAKTRWWNRGGGGASTAGTSTSANREVAKPKSYCSRGCPDSWVGDKHCDRMCKNIECGFDAGDCGPEIMYTSMLGYNIVNQIMTLTFHRNQPEQKVAISISYEIGVLTGEKKTFTKDFNISISTMEETEAPVTTKEPGKDPKATSPAEKSAFITNRPVSKVETEAPKTEAPLTEAPLTEAPETEAPLTQELDICGDDCRTEGETTVEDILAKPPTTESAHVNQIENEEGDESILFTNNNDEEGKQFKEEEPLALGDYVKINNQGRDILSIEIDQDDHVKEDQESSSNDDPEDYNIELRVLENKEELNYKALYEAMLRRKEEDLIFDRIVSTEDKTQKDYRINRETERTLRDEAGDIFPWEVLVEPEVVQQPAFGQRRLLDMFGDSLKYVNRLYTIEFGTAARKVPAHMPHLIDRDLMEEIQQKWPTQWDQTSSHSLRNPRDMQYAFSYFYYLIHKRVPVDFDKIWTSEIDNNGDGRLSINELRSFAINVYGSPLRPTVFNDCLSTLYRTCLELKAIEAAANGGSSNEEIVQTNPTEPNAVDLPESETVADIVEQKVKETKAPAAAANASLKITEKELEECHITREVMLANNRTMTDALKAYAKRTYYKTSVEGTDEVAFLMVEDNDTVTQTRLDGVRQKRHKFICLNDNINHDKPTAHLVIKVVQDFYESLFPRPSSFELPPTKSNHFKYIDEILDVVQRRKSINKNFKKIGDLDASVSK
eukprot:gene3476-3966_t